MKLSVTDQRKLVQSLDRTILAIEELVVGGLTVASEATYKTLAVTFQEASRLRLLRLGGTLRNTHDEIARFVKDDERFSQTRFMFFLNRSWLMCKGIQRAIEKDDSETLNNLLWTPTTQPCPEVSVVCLGVVKKIAAGVFCAFEFRLRDIKTAEPLIWSTVFPLKTDVEIPAEGFLHLPQKQKFNASVFLEKKSVTIRNAMLADSQFGPRRIQLTDDSKVEARNKFKDWSTLFIWEPDSALARVAQHQVSPFDVDVELHEEIVLDDYSIERPNADQSAAQSDADRDVYPLNFRDFEADVIVSRSIEGDATRAAVKKAAKRSANPGTLYGLMHYANGRAKIQPLTFFKAGEPQYISISNKSIDRKALLQALKFT